MAMNSRQKIIISLKILIPIFFVVLLFLEGINAGIIIFETPKKNIEGKVTATIKIDFGNNITYSKELTLINATVFDFLLELENSGDIKVNATYWKSFDSFVINSIKYNGINYEASANSYWSFYVNGKAATEGANKVIVKSNDLIEWKFIKF